MSLAVSRFSPLAALGILAASVPAAAQNPVGAGAHVSASSADEFYEPYQIDEDYEEDGTELPNDLVHADALTCGIHPCVIQPPAVAEAEASAKADFGHNELDVYSQSWGGDSNSSYQDSANAGCGWEDELTFTSAQPIPGAKILVRFRLEGGWQNRACFGFNGYFYDPASESACTDYCCPCYDVSAGMTVENQSGHCQVASPFEGGGFPFSFPDFDDEDGQVDTTVMVEFPLLLDTPIRFGASIFAHTASFDATSLGVEATVESLEVPFGVTLDSATNSEGAYNVQVPEPGGVGGAVGIGALAALRRRARD